MFYLIFLVACGLFDPAQSLLERHLLSEAAIGGKCLDGTPAGYYYERPPAKSDGSFWVIYFMGGGYCASFLECEAYSQTPLGSSKDWTPVIPGERSFSQNERKNPYFGNGHHVFIPYCSGDAHTGQRTVPSLETWGFHFDGHLIVQHIIEDLIRRYHLDKATHVLVTGCSAGGVGVVANLDYIADTLGPSVTVKGLPVAGWFFAGNCSDEVDEPWMPPTDYPHWKAGTRGGFAHDNRSSVLWDSYFLPDCVTNEEVAWHCQSAHVAYQYVKTPVFVLENQFDSQQMGGEFGLPGRKDNTTRGYVEYFGKCMRESVSQVGVKGPNKDNGLFFASCFDHCGGIDVGLVPATQIHGHNASEVAADWFWDRNELPHILIDDCQSEDGLPCNPSCQGY